MILNHRITHRRRSALVAVSMGVFCIELDSSALNLALPSIGRDLAHGALGPEWSISAYLLSVGTLMLGAGRLSDRFGRRASLVLGLCLFATASGLCAIAPTLPALIAARGFQGAGAALIMPPGLALLTGIFPAGTRGKATGWALGIGGVGMACGPFVGGVLTQWASWRSVFWLTVPIAALATLWARRAPETRAYDWRAQLDIPGLALATGALGALAVWVDRAPVWGWSWNSAALLLTILLLAGLFVRRERAVTDPLIDPGLLRETAYVALTAAGSVANAATVVFLFVVPLALQGPFGLRAGTAGLILLVPAILMSGAATIAGRVPSSRAIRVMSACLGGAAIALATTAAVRALPAVLLAIGACAATLGAAKALVLIATQAVVRPEHTGAASGVTTTAVTVAAGLGMACVTSVTGADLAATCVAAAIGCAVAAAPLLVLRGGNG